MARLSKASRSQKKLVRLAIAFLTVIVVAIAYLAIAYQSMVDYALKQHPTFVFAPGAEFTLTRSNNPATSPFHYVVIGDSTSLGQGAAKQTENYSYQFAQTTLLPKYPSIKISNLGVSGAKTIDVLEKQIEPAIALNPDLIMLSLGANDVTGLVSDADFRRNYTTILQKLTTSKAQVVLLNIPAFSTVPLMWQPYRWLADQRGHQFNQIVVDIGQNYPKVKIVDIYNGTEPEFRLYPERNFAQDKYHPSSAGYGVWARVIAASL
jgi:lysophospholipase L1-like esterase